jgi:hypothetical protein
MIQIRYGPSGPVLRLKDQDLGPVWKPERKKVPRLSENELFELASWGERAWPWRKLELHQLYFLARGRECPAEYVDIGAALGRDGSQLYLLGRPINAAEALDCWPATQLGMEEPGEVYNRLLYQKMYGSDWGKNWRIENLGDLVISTGPHNARLNTPRGDLLFSGYEDTLPRPALQKWLKTTDWGRLQMLSKYLFSRLLAWKLQPSFRVTDTTESINFWWEGQEPRVLVTRSEGDCWLLTPARADRLSWKNLPRLLADGLLAPHNPTAPFWVQAVSGLELEPLFLARARQAWLLPEALCLQQDSNFHFMEPGIAGTWVAMEAGLERGFLPRFVEEAGMTPTSMSRCFDFSEGYYLGQVHDAEIHLNYDRTTGEEETELWIYQQGAWKRPPLRGKAQEILARLEQEGLEKMLAIYQLVSI